MSTQTKEDSTNMDEVLKFLENEIKIFEELFDEFSTKLMDHLGY